MVHFYRSLSIAVLLACCVFCFAQTIDPPYEVGTWQGFRSAAISYTFDDNCSNQLALAVPMFNEFGFTLTLFTVTGWGPNWTGLQNAVDDGHEIGCHTVTHPSLSGLLGTQQVNEMRNSRDDINTHIAGQRCITLAYPYCTVADTSLVRPLFLAARGCQGYVESRTPADFLNISSIICGSLGSVKTGADFNARANSAASSGGWCVYLIHGINDDGGYSPLPSDTLRASLEYLNSNRNKFWVTSFGNAARYARERNSVSVSEIPVHPDTITVLVTDRLDDSLYNIPITIRRPLPQGWTSCEVFQHGQSVVSTIVDHDSVTYVMFDVVPDGGVIILSNTSATGMEDQKSNSIQLGYSLEQNYPNPFNPSTQINYSVAHNGYLSLKVYSVLGEELATLFAGDRQAGTYAATFNGTGFASGVYLYRLQTGSLTSTKKFVLLR
jgi:peptidoglycan/xylan/chitin deacetylase (PgdA/CDA1 family)